jgi:(R)-2-hydroxyacyl-CoA dehydratese activating ATPase
MICAGIDAGSRAIKVVLVRTGTLELLAHGVMDQGVAQTELAAGLFERLLRERHLSRQDVAATVATGYGRNAITFADRTVTEITCHAMGVRHLVPSARTIVDIGGQDSKSIRVSEAGQVDDFAMNDRCAAGTGCFLEIVADKLGLPLASLGNVASSSRRPAAISSTCAVFAQTEIVGLMAQQVAPADIIAGVQASIASRIAGMAGRDIAAPVVFTGGVAMVSGMDAALAAAFAMPVIISPRPQMTGAIGAAILAARQYARDKGEHLD